MVTTAAFHHFLETNRDIRKLVNELGTYGLSLEEHVAKGERYGEVFYMAEMASRIMKAIQAADPPTYLISLLEHAGVAPAAPVKFAVR